MYRLFDIIETRNRGRYFLFFWFRVFALKGGIVLCKTFDMFYFPCLLQFILDFQQILFCLTASVANTILIWPMWLRPLASQRCYGQSKCMPYISVLLAFITIFQMFRYILENVAVHFFILPLTVGLHIFWFMNPN